MSEVPVEQTQVRTVEIAGPAKYFQTMFAAADATVDDPIAIKITPEGLQASALTSDKAGMTILDYPASAFAKFLSNTTVDFGIKGEEILPVIKRAKNKNGTVVMQIDFDNSRLVFDFEGKKYKLRLVEVKSEFTQIKLSPEVTVSTSYAEWSELLDDLLLDDKSAYHLPTMFIEVKDGKFKVWRENKEGTEYETTKGGVQIPKDQPVTDNAWVIFGECDKMEFGIEKLKKITQALKSTTERITIKLAIGKAIKLEFDEGYVSYWLGSIQEKK